MISNSDIETLASIGELESSRNEILNARASFTDNGGGFIAEYLMSAGLFRKLDPSDPAQIGAYSTRPAPPFFQQKEWLTAGSGWS